MISVFDLFKIGIGPSSSHTIGPMKAAAAFTRSLRQSGRLDRVSRVRVELYGSLAWTGRGHGSDKAVLLGLSGLIPETIDPDDAERQVAELARSHVLNLAAARPIEFDPATDLVFDRTAETPFHPNTLQLAAFDAAGAALLVERWCSVGGGFIVREGETAEAEAASVPYPFADAAGLLVMAAGAGLTIAELVRANERALRPDAEIDRHLDAVIDTMMSCIDRGLAKDGVLPGGLDVRRRARSLLESIAEDERRNVRFGHEAMDKVSAFAIAVNEENAAGGRVVTAPTNGAAGVIPAVLRYYRDRAPGASRAGMRDFLLTATAVGALCKMNASISGAEVGCQGEVGSASAMAAAGLACCMGGSNAQIENAAEIGMEHHLGMTCDPIGGLVQIPCIERNAFGAVKAINAASLALHGDGSHRVSLDQVIATMRQTGQDMHSKYKETSQGGLAVNFTEC
jgi:L-serine dehydratase